MYPNSIYFGPKLPIEGLLYSKLFWIHPRAWNILLVFSFGAALESHFLAVTPQQIPQHQTSPNAFYNKAFGPKSLNI